MQQLHRARGERRFGRQVVGQAEGDAQAQAPGRERDEGGQHPHRHEFGGPGQVHGPRVRLLVVGVAQRGPQLVDVRPDALVPADGTSHPTGFWAEEVVESLRVLREAGVEVAVEVAVAAPGGVRPTVDAASLEGNDFGAAVDAVADEPASPLVLADVDAADFDAVHLPGGHGPMADLAVDGALRRLLVRFEAEVEGEGEGVAALCHGPAGLLSAVREDGAFAGREPTVFTDEEERRGGLDVPCSVEARLRDLGARGAAGPAWSSTVVVDGNLVTGQNPQSGVDTAKQVAGLPARRG